MGGLPAGFAERRAGLVAGLQGVGLGVGMQGIVGGAVEDGVEGQRSYLCFGRGLPGWAAFQQASQKGAPLLAAATRV